jgi:SAM-dependent methyltransferase
MANPPSRYVHGTDPAEQARLSLLNDLLNAACLRELDLRGGERVLDVGAGLGQLSRGMARAAGRPVLAIERSEEQLARAAALAREAGEERLLELRGGDALDLPLSAPEWGSFDVAHARFILEHVPAPERVVEQMVRAVRPGGRVALCDDDHSLLRLHPEPPGVTAAWSAFVRTYDRNGNDPYVGRRLPALLAAAGARPRRFTWVSIAACAGDAGFPGIVENLAGNLRGAREAIAATGAVGAAEVDAAVAALRVFGARPDAALGYAFPWAEGVRAGT